MTHFPQRYPGDLLDVAGLVAHGLAAAPADRVLMTFEGRDWTAAAMRDRIASLRAGLRARGLVQGDRVAVMMGNDPGLVALIYALVLSGIVWVPVNSRSKVPGLALLLERCRPKMLLASAEFGEIVRGACEATNFAGLVGDMQSLEAGSGGTAVAPCEVGALEPLAIIYTSGTTGAPKGVILTQRMLRISAEAAALVCEFSDGDELLLWEPLCHIGGAQMLLAPFMAEARLHLARRFSAKQFWTQAHDTGMTKLHYLGGILDILAGQPVPQHGIRFAWGAGVGAHSWDRIRTTLSMQLRECYGMTECSSFATANFDGTPGSIGKPLPWMRVELLGDDGRPVGEGDTGEIVLSSDVEGVFLPAYLDEPHATEKARRNGKLHTGDLARRDAQGNLYFVGRRSDSMRVRGENVSAWEVERVFAGHPSVRAVAAVPVPGAIGEQDILLYVQFKDDEQVAFGELARWADPSLPDFQRPRYFHSIDRFELTPSERIRKHLLPADARGAWDRMG
jgi:carnitine-CoA ligase